VILINPSIPETTVSVTISSALFRNGGDKRRHVGGVGLRRRSGGEDGAETLRGASDGSKQSDKG